MKQDLDSWDMKRLFVFLEERESLIKDMDQLDRKIDRLKKTSPFFREHTSGLMNDRAAHSVTELKMIIEKLSRLENEYMERLRGKSEQLKNQLLRMRSGQQAIKGYDRRSENVPKFLDMKK
jgi:GTP1/Obg family GTP-binding protein